MPTYRGEKPKSMGRRTDPGLPDMKMPKGYGGYCYDCLTLVGYEGIATGDLTPGTCDNCGKPGLPRFSMETGRFQALLTRVTYGQPL